MTICSLGNDNLLSRYVYSDILNRKFPPKKPFRPENSDCAECVTFWLPRREFNLSSGVFVRRTATGSKTSSLFICLDSTTFVLISVITLTETICLILRFSFRKLQIFISQTTDFHFVSFHFVAFRFVSLHFVSQTTVSHRIPNSYEIPEFLSLW